MKAKVELPKNNFLAKYEMYSNKKEMYVLNTINKDIEAMQDKKRFESSQFQMKEKEKREELRIKGQLKKMNDIFDAYYDIQLKDVATKESLKSRPVTASLKKDAKVRDNS